MKSQALSEGEETLVLHLRANGIEFEREAALIPGRKWRWDFYLRKKDLAIEVHGGTWSRGKHSRGNGQANDFAKANAAALAGIKVLYFDTKMVKSGIAIDTVLEALI